MTFRGAALVALQDFRKLLKSYFSAEDRSCLLQTLDLVRPRNLDQDVELWETLKKIHLELEVLTESHPKHYYIYSGIDQYFKFLSDFLAEFYVCERRVLHKAQYASGLLLNIIQMINIPVPSLTVQIQNQLKSDCVKLLVFGSEEQQHKVLTILKAKCDGSSDFYHHVLTYYTEMSLKLAKKNGQAAVAA